MSDYAELRQQAEGLYRPYLQTCGACNRKAAPTTEAARGWIWFSFKHLDACWLCPACQTQFIEHFKDLQAANL